MDVQLDLRFQVGEVASTDKLSELWAIDDQD
jgi:hypothetical protein